MGIVAKAELELKRAGLFDKDSDYGGATAHAVLDLLKVFVSQGHSGASAYITLGIFNKLAKQQTLTPITDDPIEWNDVSEMSGYPFWQNNRDSRFFSKDGGKSWYNVEDSDDKLDGAKE